MTINLGENLSKFVSNNVDEYIYHLVSNDKSQIEQQVFKKLKAELQLAFSKKYDSYLEVDAQSVIVRNA